MKEIITSMTNPQVRNLIRLQQKPAERRKQGLIVIEGAREIQMAMNAGLEIDKVFFCREVFIKDHDEDELTHLSGSFVEVAPHVFEKLAYRDTSDGIIATARPVSAGLETLQLSKVPLIVVLEAVEKPGNLGAILRTADAAGVDAVLVCDPSTDIYNPNVIRASIGCVFTVPVATCTSEEALAWLRKCKTRIYAAALQDATSAYRQDYSKPSAFIMGTEAKGLSPFWRNNADGIISIPMLGKIDSLNVSAAMAALVYEAVRQRKNP